MLEWVGPEAREGLQQQGVELLSQPAFAVEGEVPVSEGAEVRRV